MKEAPVRWNKKLACLLLVSTFAFSVSACAEDAPTLASGHPGWKKPDCWASGCHTAANTHNDDLAPYECAECHGNNGAPGGHGGQPPCMGCHADQHGGKAAGFVDPDACRTCHE
jgi:hypothetical protein